MKHAYLVPRQGRVCLDISYMGLLHLAMESGSILWGQAVIVHQNDEFKLTGLGNLPIHNYEPFGDRGDIAGVYCTVKTAHGDFLTECMSIDDVYSIRARSESYKRNSGPWLTDAGEMIKKTVVKRANKYWPKVERLSNAIEYLNTVNGEGFEQEPVMGYVDESQIKENEKKAELKLQQDTQVLIDQMEMSESEQQLKDAFAKAFKMARSHAGMSQSVQQIYAKNKNRLNIK
jgi:recombination protein RecT